MSESGLQMDGQLDHAFSKRKEQTNCLTEGIPPLDTG